MSNSNMINPANYYNPFAKYNYVSKTRGVYLPRDAAPLINTTAEVEKSASIYSENYDAETDIMQSLNEAQNASDNKGLLGFINKYLGGANN